MLKTHHTVLRPFSTFNPELEEHRMYYADFLKTGTWKNCKYQWHIDDASYDVVHYLERKLIAYYVSNELKLKTKTKRRTTNKKG